MRLFSWAWKVSKVDISVIDAQRQAAFLQATAGLKGTDLTSLQIGYIDDIAHS